jgi:hydroxylamine reductase (hybrid-cluster protein)
MEINEKQRIRQKMIENMALDWIDQLVDKHQLNQGDVFNVGAVCLSMAALWSDQEEIDLMFKVLREVVDLNVKHIRYPKLKLSNENVNG